MVHCARRPALLKLYNNLRPQFNATIVAIHDRKVNSRRLCRQFTPASKRAIHLLYNNQRPQFIVRAQAKNISHEKRTAFRISRGVYGRISRCLKSNISPRRQAIYHCAAPAPSVASIFYWFFIRFSAIISHLSSISSAVVYSVSVIPT